MKLVYRQKKFALLLWAVLALSLAAAPACAQRNVTIKLASLVPENTPWGEAINRMAVEWARATNGEVELIVYHNGVAGSEADVLRKLRMNQIQAAMFTSIGLNAVTPEVMALSYPLLIHNNEELDVVLEKIRPELETRLERSGFTTLAWAKAGWVKIFSRAPVFSPAEMRRQKMASSPDELEMLQAFKTMGFQMVPVDLNDVLVSLNSGMLDAVYQSPVFVANLQVFAVAKNMSSLNLAPFMGSILMNEAAWRRIPDQHKEKIMQICKQIENEIEYSIARLEEDAITTMVKYGLQINTLSPAQEQDWYQEIDRHESALAGPVFNREIYIRIKSILTDYRQGR
ncbi:MAG: TRAP transporter substrate-binding protein DctP [Treponema sp.]|nr:TRAP transporter substrate-binding protein DctP [Treponema sp.]